MLGFNVGVCPNLGANYRAPLRGGAWWSVAKWRQKKNQAERLLTTEGESPMNNIVLVGYLIGVLLIAAPFIVDTVKRESK